MISSLSKEIHFPLMWQLFSFFLTKFAKNSLTTAANPAGLCLHSKFQPLFSISSINGEMNLLKPLSQMKSFCNNDFSMTTSALLETKSSLYCHVFPLLCFFLLYIPFPLFVFFRWILNFCSFFNPFFLNSYSLKLKCCFFPAYSNILFHHFIQIWDQILLLRHFSWSD